MTTAVPNEPDLIEGARRRRIAAGSGQDVQAVNALLKQFNEMKKMMKMLMKGGGKLPPGFGDGMGMPGLGGPGGQGPSGFPQMPSGRPGRR
jgi:signal recognition particle subunit SRP54